MNPASTIPSKEDFLSLPAKQDKKDMLIMLRKEFPDKDIREAWNMDYKNFYQTLYRYGLAGKKKEQSMQEFDDRQGNQSSQGVGTATAVPNDQNWPRKREPQVLDAEYTPVTDTGAGADSRALVLGDRREAMEMPFPTIKGTPDRLRKQFEAIAMFLEAEGEETRFQVELKVYKEG